MMRLNVTLAILMLAIAVTMIVAPRHAHAGTTRVIEIKAKRFGFTPNQIVLKKGEPVTLRLSSEDVTHGLYVKKLNIDEVIEAGKSTDVIVTPDTVGSFTPICDHFCGANHGSMNMTIVVTE